MSSQVGQGWAPRGWRPACSQHFSHAQGRRETSCQEPPLAAKSSVVPRTDNLVFVSQDGCKKSPPTWWSETTGAYCSGSQRSEIRVRAGPRRLPRCQGGLLCPVRFPVTIEHLVISRAFAKPRPRTSFPQIRSHSQVPKVCDGGLSEGHVSACHRHRSPLLITGV